MYVRPKFGLNRFSCPRCGALAHQFWYQIRVIELDKNETPFRVTYQKVDELENEMRQKMLTESLPDDDVNFLKHLRRIASRDIFIFEENSKSTFSVLNGVDATRCDSCDELSIWMQDRLIYPVSGPTGTPSEDMPPKVRELYDEASAVFTTSPRASAALLRLALQHLLIELGGDGENINADIKKLIDKGNLKDRYSRLMHAIRITGNESVHPGEIDVNDDPEIAEALFGFIDRLVDELITAPKEEGELWNKLPESKRKAAEEQISKSTVVGVASTEKKG